MLTTTDYDAPAFNTRSRTAQQTTDQSTPQQNPYSITPDIPTVVDTPNATPKPLTEDKLQALLQMQRTYSFCKCILKHCFIGKAPQHEADLFLYIKRLLYKHVTDSNQKFLTLVIPKAWKYTLLVEADDKLGHQGGTCTYCIIK